jgi:hypothetical protein
MEIILEEKRKKMIQDIGPTIRYSDASFCVECYCSIKYSPMVYPYSQYLCFECSKTLLKK